MAYKRKTKDCYAIEGNCVMDGILNVIVKTMQMQKRS